MEIRELEQLKTKIEEAKTTVARAEGGMSRIKSQWQSDFEVNTLEEAEALLTKMDGDLTRDEARLKAKDL